MNKFYCFHCQKEVEPKEFFRWRFCPHCRHKITDSGEGLYLICDSCGANNQVTATKCVKCGYGLNGNESKEVKIYDYVKNSDWLQLFVEISVVILGLIFSIFVLYISFYLVFAFLIFGVVYWLFAKITPKL